MSPGKESAASAMVWLVHAGLRRGYVACQGLERPSAEEEPGQGTRSLHRVPVDLGMRTGCEVGLAGG